MNTDNTPMRPVPSRPRLGARALAALGALAPVQQGQVLRSFESLGRAAVGSGRWRELQPYYPALGMTAMRAGDDLLAVFQLAEGAQPEVIDILVG